jgi:hypothetical protein
MWSFDETNAAAMRTLKSVALNEKRRASERSEALQRSLAYIRPATVIRFKLSLFQAVLF